MVRNALNIEYLGKFKLINIDKFNMSIMPNLNVQTVLTQVERNFPVIP